MFRIRLKKNLGVLSYRCKIKKNLIFLEFIIYSNMVDV